MSNYTIVELEDLVGDRFLSDVGYYDWNPNPSDYDGVTFNFILDGMLYAVVEDANDGYRSSLRDVFVTDHIGQVSNTFSPVAVVCEMDKEHDVLHILDKVTGEPIIRIGTEEHDWYYPCFINNYNPEAMSVNKFLEETTVVKTNLDWLVEDMRKHGGFSTFPKTIASVLEEIDTYPEVDEIKIDYEVVADGGLGLNVVSINMKFPGLELAAKQIAGPSITYTLMQRVNAYRVLFAVREEVGEDTARVVDYMVKKAKIYTLGNSVSVNIYQEV